MSSEQSVVRQLLLRLVPRADAGDLLVNRGRADGAFGRAGELAALRNTCVCDVGRRVWLAQKLVWLALELVWQTQKLVWLSEKLVWQTEKLVWQTEKLVWLALDLVWLAQNQVWLAVVCKGGRHLARLVVVELAQTRVQGRLLVEVLSKVCP